MPTKFSLCTCQRYCQAPPGGKLVALRTWQQHAAQRELEEGMSLEEVDLQVGRTYARKRTRVQVTYAHFKIQVQVEIITP